MTLVNYLVFNREGRGGGAEGAECYNFLTAEPR